MNISISAGIRHFRTSCLDATPQYTVTAIKSISFDSSPGFYLRMEPIVTRISIAWLRKRPCFPHNHQPFCMYHPVPILGLTHDPCNRFTVGCNKFEYGACIFFCR
ncbi:Protein STB5 [Fusarium oxysporum f. sp. albedinis]|nr:Protein STB5 [Fusarium oxysporum f. sp. albedinis]